MKKLFALIIALMLALSLAACGAEAETEDAEEADSTSMAESTVESTAEEAVSEAASAPAAASTDWNQYADVLTVCYLGKTNAEEPVVFCANDDISFAILGVVDPNTMNSISCVGDVVEQDNGYLTITDRSSGYALTFAVTQNDDGTITLDMGDVGSCTIAKCSQEDAFSALDTLSTATNAVA